MGRTISALLYLNNDYTGGHLEFPNFGIKIKPEPGMLILFPSNFAYRHQSTPVISGTKYCLVTWIRDRAT
jgi:predicted 2-oxoglutarate/Fe(II)-dependent dioxygenase YbiX